MTTTTHTPGPWDWSSDVTGFLNITSPSGDVAEIRTEDVTGGRPHAEAEANARLITAAPAMRELLERLTSAWAEPNGDGTAVVDHDYLTALQADADALLAGLRERERS